MDFKEGDKVCEQWYNFMIQRGYPKKPLLYFTIAQAGICYSMFKNNGIFAIKQLEGVYTNPLFPMIREEKLASIKKKVTNLKTASTNKQIIYLCDMILKTICFVHDEFDLENRKIFMENCDKEIQFFVNGM